MFDRGQFLTLIRDANNENYAWGTKKAARELLFNRLVLEGYLHFKTVEDIVVACARVHREFRGVLVTEPRR